MAAGALQLRIGKSAFRVPYLLRARKRCAEEPQTMIASLEICISLPAQTLVGSHALYSITMPV